MSDIRKLMNATKGYSEVSQEVQEGWLKDTFDKIVDTLGLGEADKDRVIDAAETKTTEIDKIEAEAQAKLDSAANDKYQNDKIDNIANASDAEAKAKADKAAATTKGTNSPSDAELDAAGVTADGNNRPSDAELDALKPENAPKITAEIQAELQARGLDKGIIGELLSPEDIAALKKPVPPATGTDDADDAAIATEPNTTFDSINDAQNADNLKAGDIITIDGKEAEVGETDDGQQFFVHPGSDIPIDKPKPPAPQGELSATDTAQTGVPPEPEAQQSAGPDDGTRANQEPNREPAAPSNGSLLGRKLDLTTPNLMKAYNDGGKKAMPAIRNMQTALSRLGFDPNGIDGKYGNGTFKAVQAFQKANGLAVDGQSGPETMKSMKASLDGNFEKNKVTPADTADKAAADTSADDPMTAANQQKDIDTAQPNADLDRYIELLNKLEGTGADEVKPETVTSSYDFGKLIALVESKLLNEQLTQAEMEELKALHNKVQGHVGTDTELDTKITTALNRYLKLVKEPADKADAQNKASDAQLIAKGQAAKADAQNKASDAQLIAKGQAAKAQSAEPKVSKELYVQMAPNRNASLGNFNVSKMKAKYPKPYVDIPNKDGTITRGYGPLKNLEDFVANKGKKFKAKIIGKPAQQAGVPNAELDGAQRGVQTASKDNNMKKAIEESASMNVSMTADNASEVADLMALLKNAGMPDASPVSDMPMSPSKGLPAPHDHEHGGHDDMKSMIALMGDDDAPCGEDCGCDSCATDEDSSSEEYDAIVDEWDNSPEEEYKDHNYMTKDLSGGLNREKKAYAKAQDGDNAMAVEAIKSNLRKALEEALANK